MKLRITVEGKAYDVDVEILPEGQGNTAPVAARRVVAAPAVAAAPTVPPAAAVAAPVPAAPLSGGSTASSDQVVKAPIAGTIIEIKVGVGDAVGVNQVLVVMEAMKMETNIASPVAGKVAAIKVAPREAVNAGHVLVELE
jgi:biotin carboxyl carrier protein